MGDKICAPGTKIIVSIHTLLSHIALAICLAPPASLVCLSLPMPGPETFGGNCGGVCVCVCVCVRPPASLAASEAQTRTVSDTSQLGDELGGKAPGRLRRLITLVSSLMFSQFSGTPAPSVVLPDPLPLPQELSTATLGAAGQRPRAAPLRKGKKKRLPSLM